MKFKKMSKSKQTEKKLLMYRNNMTKRNEGSSSDSQTQELLVPPSLIHLAVLCGSRKF